MIETVPSGTILHGRYRIERVLGSGGFGHVYLATDLTVSQQYAVKEYMVSGQNGQEQLRHEATVLGQLHHPNLPAFQHAFIERERYYVVLNYIEGNDLTDLIRTTRQHNEAIPVAQILHWVLSICDAVMFLHNQQPTVIHRDIKPDNIRITPNGTATLVDLGNAKAAADGARTLFFIRHQGTPGYAPPEQYPGGSGTDARSDVYALGGTLYFALTAQEPPSVSTRNQAIQQGQKDLMSLQDILANNPPEESPEAHAARQFRLGVSKPAKPVPRHSRHIAQLGALPPETLNQINMIIQKALALKPKHRYALVADFANDLKTIIGLLPVPPTPSRKIDMHSTQPDLAELYDAIQEAKENASRGKSDSGTQPMNPNNNQCPRCSNPLAPQAAFCPRCGLALSRTSPAARQQATMQPPGDLSGERTLIIPQQQVKQIEVSYASTARANVIAAPISASNKPNTPIQVAPQATSVTVSPSWQHNTMDNGTAPSGPMSKFNLIIFLFLCVVIVIALVLMAVLLLHW